MLDGAVPVGGRHIVDEFRLLGDSSAGRWTTVVPVGARHLWLGCALDQRDLVEGVVRTAATDLAVELGSRFSVGDTPADHEFDALTGVPVALYPVFPYQSLPPGGGRRDHFARHVDHERGDALLLLGSRDGTISQLAPRCDELLGCPFTSLVESLSGLQIEQ